MFSGIPFSIASYSLLLSSVARQTGLEVGESVHTLGDAHIYKNHSSQVEKQLSRDSSDSPKLWLNPARRDTSDFEMEDIRVVDYKHHGVIKAPVAAQEIVTLSPVWAEDSKHQIGYKRHLPWYLPANLVHFKEKTMRKTMVMREKTFPSSPFVLPKRKHLVLTHDEVLIQKYKTNNQVDFVTSMEQLRRHLLSHKEDEVVVISGVNAFERLKDTTDCLEKTEVDGEFKVDTVMSKIDYSAFKLVEKEGSAVDKRNPYDYSFLAYLRR